MAADLDPVAGGAVVVGGVDDAGGEPQDALLDLVEYVEINAECGGAVVDHVHVLHRKAPLTGHPFDHMKRAVR